MSDVSAEQYEFLNRLVGALSGDEHIEAIWLEGSLARGDADCYSDVDLHAYVPFNGEEPISRLQADLPTILSAAGQVRFLRTFPHTTITTGVMDDGARFDVVLETEEDLRRPRKHLKILYDRSGGLWERLRTEEGPPPVDPDRVAFLLDEFWRCVGLLPIVMARGELIAAHQGHMFMINIVAEIALAADGIPRTWGAKRLNPYLKPSDRLEMEEMLPAAPDFFALAEGVIRMAQFVARRGRECAAQHGIPYPEEWERSTLRNLKRELNRFGSDLTGVMSRITDDGSLER